MRGHQNTAFEVVLIQIVNHLISPDQSKILIIQKYRTKKLRWASTGKIPNSTRTFSFKRVLMVSLKNTGPKRIAGGKYY
jgi:hypothetical protein